MPNEQELLQSRIESFVSSSSNHSGYVEFPRLEDESPSTCLKSISKYCRLAKNLFVAPEIENS